MKKCVLLIITLIPFVLRSQEIIDIPKNKYRHNLGWFFKRDRMANST